MEVRLFIILLLTIILSKACLAYTPKEGNIFAAFGPTVMKTLFDPSTGQPTSGWNLDGALFIQGDVNSRGSLEISIFHFNKSFYRDHDGQFAAEKLEQMHIGLGYRYWTSEKLSLGLAFSSSYAMTEAQVIHKEPTNNLLDTSARDTSEFCFDFSVQYLIWEQDQSSVFADIRYSRGITSRVGEKGDHLVTTIAYRQFIQGK